MAIDGIAKLRDGLEVLVELTEGKCLHVNTAVMRLRLYQFINLTFLLFEFPIEKENETAGQKHGEHK